MTTGAILLAAGLSRRFGSIKLNALLPDGSTLLEKTSRLLQSNISEIIVVTRPALLDAGVLANTGFTRQQIVVCPDADQGMGHSLAFGIRSLPAHWDACLVCLADMPFINASTLQQIHTRASRDRILIPTYQQQRGHPVAFGRDFFTELTQSRGDTGGRDVIKNHPDQLVLVELDDIGILQDIDTPEDLPAC
ncbi:MAG: nucleotidyltransferase family protein [Pseudohongiella sp.]